MLILRSVLTVEASQALGLKNLLCIKNVLWCWQGEHLIELLLEDFSINKECFFSYWRRKHLREFWFHPVCTMTDWAKLNRNKKTKNEYNEEALKNESWNHVRNKNLNRIMTFCPLYKWRGDKGEVLIMNTHCIKSGHLKI